MNAVYQNHVPFMSMLHVLRANAAKIARSKWPPSCAEIESMNVICQNTVLADLMRYVSYVNM